MQKITKSITHVWIALSSMAVFVFGWAVFAHSEKPAPLSVQGPTPILVEVPTLEPIPSLDELLASSRPQTAQIFTNPSISFPRLRTRGS